MRILKDALIVLYVIIAIITTILLLSCNKYRVSVFGDYSIVLVDNNELEPSFSKGDMVIVKSSNMYKVGESVFFYNVVDRKIQVTLANISKVEEVTDGISGYEIPGGSLISHDEVIGSTNNVKVFHHIGSFLKFIESKYGYLLLVVIPSGAALLYEIYNFIVTRKEEIEEEKAEQERRKRLAKKRAKERLLARKQETELNEEEFEEDVEENEEVEDIEELEEPEEPEEQDEPIKEMGVKRDRESIRASIAQNKRAYEEKIQKLKSNYEKKVEKHPEIDDDEDLKVTNQSNKVEKANDLKEKANNEAVNAVRKSSKVHTASVRHKIPTRVPTTNTKSTSTSSSSETRKAPSPIARARAASSTTSVENKESESTTKSNSATSSTTARRSNVATAKRLAAIRAANAEKANNTNTSESNVAKRTATPVRRGVRVQSKKIVNSRKVDEKD